MTATGNPIIDRSAPVRDMRAAVLAEHYRALDWTVPRFYQSPTALAGGGSQFRGAFVEDCLVIVKWKQFYSQRVAYAILPPMSYRGNADDERRAVLALQENGFGVMLVEQDLARLDLRDDDLELVRGNAEYVYRASDLAKLEGGRWASLRTQKHRAERDGYRCVTSTVLEHGTDDLVALTQRWVKYRGKGASMLGYAKSLGGWPDTTVFRLYVDDELSAYSYTEDVGTGALITSRLRDYAVTGIHDPMSLLAHHEAAWELEHKGDRLMNLGAADPVGGAGLRQHKAALHPLFTQQVYRLPPLATPAPVPAPEPAQLEMVL